MLAAYRYHDPDTHAATSAGAAGYRDLLQTGAQLEALHEYLEEIMGTCSKSVALKHAWAVSSSKRAPCKPSS
jgi:hypothetical protein